MEDVCRDNLLEELGIMKNLPPWYHPSLEEYLYLELVQTFWNLNMLVCKTRRGRYICRDMELPFDVLDYIFGLLRSDPQSLVECSKAHPGFSRILNRHLFYHIVIRLDDRSISTLHGYNLFVFDVIELVSETPQLVDNVRILQIELNTPRFNGSHLEEFASILPTFSALQFIILGSRRHIVWQDTPPPSFRTALEGCFQLPTLQKVYVCNLAFPLSLLGTNPNVNFLILSGLPQIPASSNDPFPQLKSLSFDRIHGPPLRSFSNWAKRHITNLQSLKCDYEEVVSELLEACSDTLENLDIDFNLLTTECESSPSSFCPVLYKSDWRRVSRVGLLGSRRGV